MKSGAWSLCLFALACQSPGYDFAAASEPLTLGEAVYALVHGNLEHSLVCPGARVSTLEAVRDPFIQTFDSAVGSTTAALAQTVGAQLVPLIESGELQALTEDAARVAGHLIDENEDPERAGLQALLEVAQAHTVLPPRHVWDWAGHILRDPDLKEWLHAANVLAGNEYRDAPAAKAFFVWASDALQTLSEPSGCTGPSGEHVGSLLTEGGLDAAVDFGEPAWIVLADGEGRPQVATDPSTGRLYAPFVDIDADGVAETNAEGQPVDAAGRPIEVAPFGDDGARDADGRALAQDGRPLYRYVDSKRTGLGILAQYLGEAVTAGRHEDLLAVVLAVLGEPAGCDAADGCVGYGAADHPLADFSFALLEDLRYERVAALLASWEQVVIETPEVAEAILVSAGEVLSALDESNLKPTDGALVDLLTDVFPLLADVFEQDAEGTSTARLLLDVFDSLAGEEAKLKKELLLSLQYVTLAKDDACAAEDPDLGQSIAVDYTKPRWLGLSTDNRSGMEQTIELFAAMDCGDLSATDEKTVAEVLVELLADQEAGAVCSLLDGLMGAIGVAPALGDFLGAGALDLAGCDGDVVWPQVKALDELAKSGLLDVYLPIAKAFVDRGQTRTLIDVFRLLATDLQTSDSTVRRALPAVIAMLKADVLTGLFDMVEALVVVPAVDGTGSMADVVVDSFAYLTRDSEPVRTRQGWVYGTSVGLQMLGPYREILRRLDAAGETYRLERLIDHLGSTLRETTVAQGGSKRLADRRLLAALRQVLGFLSGTFDLTETQRACYFDWFGERSNTLWTHAAFAELLALTQLYVDTPEHGAIDAAIGAWLQPGQDAGELDRLGAFMRVLGAIVQVPREDVDMAALTELAARMLSDLRAEAMIASLDQLVTQDPQDALLHLADRLTQPAIGVADQTAVGFFAELFGSISVLRETSCTAPVGEWSLADAEAAVAEIIAFMTEEQSLPAIYRLIATAR